MRKAAWALLMLFSSEQNLKGIDAEPGKSPWRSALYPADWTPAWTDREGRFLHDFSYAGYHRGEKSWTDVPSARFARVTDAPYFADATGQSNAAPAIQKALDDMAAQGGGTVIVPQGRYRLDFQPQQKAALRIRASHVVLRGEGAGTRLFTRETMMRDKTLILVAPAVPSWRQPADQAAIPLAEDARARDVTIKLQNVAGLAAGDSLVIRADVTPDFARELSMEEDWDTRLEGPHFYREIRALDPATGIITLDVPLRFPLKTRDFARAHKVSPPLVEVGVANLALGMAEQTVPGLSEDDFDKPGTAGYQSHRAFLLRFMHVQHSWIQGVESFALDENKGGFHTQSGGIALHQVRFITVDNTEMAFPQYKGAGGNGYLYELQNAQEVLVQNARARAGRHNFDVKSMGSSGLVFFKCLARDGVLSSDFHMYLAQAVLFDSMQVDGDQLEAKFRDAGTIKHGQTTTQSVFWNTTGQRYRPGRTAIVHSQQWGIGYVIGTQGPASAVSNPGGQGTEPRDWVEGAGQGQLLDPPSLYEDQLRRRLSAASPLLQKE